MKYWLISLDLVVFNTNSPFEHYGYTQASLYRSNNYTNYPSRVISSLRWGF